MCINPLVKKFCLWLCSLCVHIVVTEGVKWQEGGSPPASFSPQGRGRPPIKRTTALQRGQMVTTLPQQSQQQGRQVAHSLQNLWNEHSDKRGQSFWHRHAAWASKCFANGCPERESQVCCIGQFSWCKHPH